MTHGRFDQGKSKSLKVGPASSAHASACALAALCLWAQCACLSYSCTTRALTGVAVLRSQAADRTFTIRYGSGVVDGVVVYDTVELGIPLANVTKQGIGLAVNSTADFASTSCDGIFVRPALKAPCTTCACKGGGDVL